MNQLQDPDEWGPSHDAPAGGKGWRLAVLWFVFMLGYGLTGSGTWTVVLIAGLVGAARLAIAWQAQAVRLCRTAGRLAKAADKFAAVRNESAARGGVYLGLAANGEWVTARPERAVLLLGPPRSGKTSGVMIPAVLAHPGPVVCASTKPEVLTATSGCRRRLGTVWQFDPTGTNPSPGGRQLRWSPVTGSRSWDGALMIARSMVTGTGVGAGTTDQSHWSRRAQALLAPMLHAAAIDNRGIGDVVNWVFSHQLDQPGVILHHADATLAGRVLAGLANTEARERSSIFSAAADGLDAYTATGPLQAASDPNFDPLVFARSWDTIYIHAPAEHQALAAPLVCGLLAEIRAATYQVARDLMPAARMLFALDEVANIAPLAELPQIASEGGGQNLTLLAAFQDLSQARARWGTAADGFLTLSARSSSCRGSLIPGRSRRSRLRLANTTAKSSPPRAPKPGSPGSGTAATRSPPNGSVCSPRVRSRTSLPGTRCTSTVSTGGSSRSPPRTGTSPGGASRGSPRSRSPTATASWCLGRGDESDCRRSSERGRFAGRFQHRRCVECIAAVGTY